MKKQHRGQKLNIEHANSGYSEMRTQLPKGICYLCLPAKQRTLYLNATEEHISLDMKVSKMANGKDLTLVKTLGRLLVKAVMYPHVHMIPRRKGDMADPTGGVRHVIPEKGNYKKTKEQPIVESVNW